MIEKFNFYDVYGYFLPGLALIAVLWFPFGLVVHFWPKGDWGSAIVAVALAYFVGHLMLYVSTNVIPSYDVKKSKPGKERNPSETLLDADSTDLSQKIREKIASAIRREFQLEVHIETTNGDYDKDRKEAFFLARQRLILAKTEGYAEQFQGMYSLARGLVVALSVGTAYYFGWVLSALQWIPLLILSITFDFVCLLAIVNLVISLFGELDRARKQRLERRFGLIFLMMFFFSGCAVGFGYKFDSECCVILALAAAIALVLSFRCYIQYRVFTVRFAVTVWRDFTAYTFRESGPPDLPSRHFE